MPFNPFGKESPVSISGLQGEINRLFDRLYHAGVSTGPFDGQEWAPPLDVYERPESYVVQLEVAGVDGDSIELNCLGRALTIRGEKTDPPTADHDLRPVHRERRYGAFCRTVDIPADIDAENISAACHGGILEVTLPKSQAGIPRKIKIESPE